MMHRGEGRGRREVGARKFAEVARGSMNPKGKGKENMTTKPWKVRGRMRDMIVFRREKQEKKRNRRKSQIVPFFCC